MSSAITPKNAAFAELKAKIASNLEALHEQLRHDGGETAEPDRAQAFLRDLQQALSTAEAYGAAFLAEEMEIALAAFAESSSDRAEELSQLLAYALLALESYIDRLQRGDSDRPLVLLPLLNDLRAVRDAPLLSECAIFQPDFSVTPPLRSSAPSGDAEAIEALARQLRPYYQAGLVAWYRNPADGRGLKQLGSVMSRLERNAVSQESRRLWWICHGLLEALAQGGLDPGVSIRSLLGRIDRQIKRLADEGEASFATAPPTDLLKNLLFYIARARSDGVRVSQLRQSFDLEHIWPAPEIFTQDLTGARSEMLQTIAEAVKDGLFQVKIAVDDYALSNGEKIALLQPAPEILQQTADALSVLGLGKVRKDILKQAELLDGVVRGAHRPTEKEMMELAYVLLHVEAITDGMDAELGHDNTAADDGADGPYAALTATALDAMPCSVYHSAFDAAIRECRNNLTAVNNQFAAFIADNPKRESVAVTLGLLDEASGALRILLLNQGADLVDGLRQYLADALLDAAQNPSRKTLRLFAETVAGLDHYLETVALNRPPFAPLLAIPQRCLDELGIALSAEPRRTADDVLWPPQAHEPLLADLDQRQPETAANLAGEKDGDAIEPGPIQSEGFAQAPDLLDSFISETQAGLENILRFVEQCRASAGSRELAASIGHTVYAIRMNARTLGIDDIARLGELLENYIKKTGKAVVTAEVQDILTEFCDMTTRVLANLSQADSLGHGEAAAAASPPPVVALQQPPRVPVITDAQPLAKEEHSVIDRFFDEANELPQMIAALMLDWLTNGRDGATLATLRGHLQTLQDSARTAGVTPVADLSGALELLAEAILNHRIEATEEVTSLFRRATDNLADMMVQLRDNAIPYLADDVLTTIDTLLDGSDDVPASVRPSAAPPVAQADATATLRRDMRPTADDNAATGHIVADLVDSLVNYANEESILNRRVEDKLGQLRTYLTDMAATVENLRTQFAKSKAGIDERGKKTTRIDELLHIQDELLRITGDAEAITRKKGEIHKELQQALLSSRSVTFAKQTPRLQNCARQAAKKYRKDVRLQFNGTERKLDRALLDLITGPLEHIIGHAIANDIETAQIRRERGKALFGTIVISLTQEGAENVLRISDDGAGTDLDAVDIGKINTEIQQLGGALSIDSTPSAGTAFTIRLPSATTMIRSLLVGIGEEVYAIPSINVVSSEQIDGATLKKLQKHDNAAFAWRDQNFRFQTIGDTVARRKSTPATLVLICCDGVRIALHVDELLGTREIVVRSADTQAARHVCGATVLDDGRVAGILEVDDLLGERAADVPTAVAKTNDGTDVINVLMADDSITARRVTERFLSRHNMTVTPVKDGMEALQYLEKNRPHIILLDNDMPRMDGFEVAETVRRNPHWSTIPIIMLTSSLKRHQKERALAIGIDRCLGKPYRESELLEHIHALTSQRP